MMTHSFQKLKDVYEKYLEICKTVPGSANMANIKGHLFKLFHSWYVIPINFELRVRF
jgi:hypothetical protein